MTKREMMMRLIYGYFHETNSLKINIDQIVELLEGAGIDMSRGGISSIMSIERRQGYIHSVRSGEYMLGHRKRDQWN